MILCRAISFFLIATGVNASVFSGKQGHLDLEYMIKATHQARAIVLYLKSFVRDHMLPPPHINKKLPTQGPCFFQHQPLVPASEAIDIRIVAHEDDEVITGSRPVTIEIRSSTARIDSSKLGWKMEDEELSSIELSAGASGAGVEVSTSVSTGTRTNLEKSGENELQQEHQMEVSKSFECSSYTICTVQTWTYVAQIQGTCPRVPMIDAKCIKDEALKQLCAANMFNPSCPPPPPIELDFWESMDYMIWTRTKRKRSMQTQGIDMIQFYQSPLYQTLERNLWHHRNISLPSINDQWPAFNKIQQFYYNMTKMDGSQAGQVLPETLRNGIWRASEDKYNIVYNSIDRCNFSTPLYISKGKPKRTQVIIERPIDFSTGRAARWAKSGRERWQQNLYAQRWKGGVKVTVLSNDIY
ncbi:hypothetical protein CDD82_1056 [Ophiocordyceps australis]|uniref:Uncharacterized protein n=1 Tax=Ophiocordyceps australis TaxID=1399860 RepID=A0A2C5ZNB6_9HYPO|nr:hypothetical protein CDD82_1056 [Ophiocordyceps australis]